MIVWPMRKRMGGIKIDGNNPNPNPRSDIFQFEYEICKCEVDLENLNIWRRYEGIWVKTQLRPQFACRPTIIDDCHLNIKMSFSFLQIVLAPYSLWIVMLDKWVTEVLKFSNMFKGTSWIINWRALNLSNMQWFRWGVVFCLEWFWHIYVQILI